MILIDIDFFKRFNDTYGHQAGDVCLQRVAACIQTQFLRPRDLVARYGGEEFVCILPDTPLNGSILKANQLAHAVRSLVIPHDTSDVDGGFVTISLGVATTIPLKGGESAELLLCADDLLYAAKSAGRDRVEARSLVSRC